MGTVFRDRDGNWRGQVELPKLDGKRRKKVFYGGNTARDKREVQAKVNDIEYKLQNNLYIDETTETLEEYLKKWIAIYGDGLAETTKQLYEMYARVHINPFLGEYLVKEIKPIQIQDYYNTKQKSLSPNSVGKLHTFLNCAFKDAVRNRLIVYNPCEGVNKPKRKKYTPVIYDEVKFTKLLEVAKGVDLVCILLAGSCGLRRGEIFGLRPRDIDYVNQRISIIETMVRFEKKWIIKPPKNEKSTRSIKVPKFVLNVLQSYLGKLKVIPDRIMQEYLPSSYSHHFKALLSANNLEHIRFHDLRHYNATIMLKYGISDKVASGRLGHSQVQTTREIYQHVLEEMDNHASDILEKNTPFLHPNPSNFN